MGDGSDTDFNFFNFSTDTYLHRPHSNLNLVPHALAERNLCMRSDLELGSDCKFLGLAKRYSVFRVEVVRS